LPELPTASCDFQIPFPWTVMS